MMAYLGRLGEINCLGCTPSGRVSHLRLENGRVEVVKMPTNM